jgi:3-oxoacid CoA-transferase subunit B
MAMGLDKFQIAKRIARELRDGYYVNLGIGIPTLVANYIPAGMDVILQSENGLLGMGPFPKESEVDPDLINAGKQTVTTLKGSSLFSSAESFAMIRGSHVDLTVLGAMEVADNGDIANWKIPGKMVKGMGGAMDLVAATDNIIVAMMQTNPKGESKLLPACTLPITGKACIQRVVTDLGYYEIKSGAFNLIEIAPGVTVDEIKAKTLGKLVVSDNLKVMEV